jgi:glycosyltransferase involved in cell wall biosynthesis
MTLQLLISTLNEGINSVAQLVLPPREGIGYVVSWQHSGNEEIALPVELQRPDVEVYNLQGRGLSRNRNNAIRHATADVCLIADDDCRYTHERLQQVIDTFEQNPNVDIATFRFEGEGSNKFFPTYSFNLSKFPKGYFVSSIEIAFRRERVQGKLWFNENFGLGAKIFDCGEEHIFIQDALSQALTCLFFPITVVRENDSTVCVKRDVEPGTLMAHGAILQLYNPSTVFLRILLKAYRLCRYRNVPFFKAVRHMKKGAQYMKSHPEILTDNVLNHD